jgi:hypothetical protein
MPPSASLTAVGEACTSLVPGTGVPVAVSHAPVARQKTAIPESTRVAFAPEDPDIIAAIHRDKRAPIVVKRRDQRLGLAGQPLGGHSYHLDLTSMWGDGVGSEHRWQLISQGALAKPSSQMNWLAYCPSAPTVTPWPW